MKDKEDKRPTVDPAKIGLFFGGLEGKDETFLLEVKEVPSDDLQYIEQVEQFIDDYKVDDVIVVHSQSTSN